MAYADYEYYITTYLGTAIQEADFPAPFPACKLLFGLLHAGESG